MSLRDRQLRFNFWNASLLPATSKLFSQCLSSDAFGSSFEIFLSATNISYLWHCKFQQISTHAFCSWDDKIFQDKNGGSPNNLRMSSKSTPSLKSNTFVVGKFKSVDATILHKNFNTNECQKLF